VPHSATNTQLAAFLAEDMVVIATHNAGKLREISAIFADMGVTTLGADAFALIEPEETGATFEANALLKAESGVMHVPQGHFVLADDSGLSVDALDGLPGIYSARWAGDERDFAVAMQRIHSALTAKGVEPEGARARFVCVLALTRHGAPTLTFRGEVQGHLTFPPRGEKGFGYDPIFIPEGEAYTFAEMDASAKYAISHRTRAFAALMDTMRGKTL
jgi:XTP/dITP diphosphohydrolase